MAGTGKQPISRDILAERAREMHLQAEALDSIVDHMKKRKIASVDAMNGSLAIRGLKWTGGLIRSCKKGLDML